MSERHWTIAEASAALDRGDVSPVDLTELCLRRIAALDGTLHSYVLTLPDAARTAARAAEAEIRAGRRRGPLHGIPVALKDIYETKGIRTTGHSKIRVDHVPTTDASTVEALAKAGTILLGKLATHEFAMGGPSFDLPFPPARNAWNPRHFTGGSSSGSGAAVAAGLALGTLGSDTGGSIRGPSALCGLAGLKPSYGRVSRAGVFPLAFSLDHCGPMAWTSRDCALLLQAIAGHDPRDPASAAEPVPDYAAALGGDLKGMRIGIPRAFFSDDPALDREVGAAVEQAIKVLGDLGAVAEEVRLSPLDDYHAACLVIMLAEAFAIHETDLSKRWRDYGEIFRRRIMPGAFISGVDYVQATRLRRRLADEMDRALERNVALALPTGLIAAPLIDAVPGMAFLEKAVLTSPANVTGHPALNVCCGFTKAGLPIGLQLIGRRFDEATLLRMGDAYERATPWRGRRPEL
ncbi:MAG TPA: amidase [Stellaceae bacterium]|nr:amidase [Stellaceae bacterium]